MRIGVFVCHCGSNIAGTVDVAELAKRALTLKDVVHAETSMYTCSEPGQAAIQNAIQDKKLDRVVVAACSPHMHEVTFRRCVEKRGPQPLPLRDGQHPRALLLDPHRHAGGHREGLGHHQDGRGQGPPARAALRPTRSRSTRTCWSSAAAWPASRPRSTWPTRASRSPSSRKRPPSAASWPSSTRPSPPSTARPAS